MILVAITLVAIDGALFAQSNQYLHFDRVDDYCTLPDGSQFIANQNAFSMAGWFWTDQHEYGQGLISFRSSIEGFYLIQLDNGKLECRFNNSNNVLSEVVGPANTVVPGVWQHFAMVYDGSAITVYKNGNVLGTSPASGVFANANVEFTIGHCILGNLNFYFGGRADEVSVWSKAISQTEIQDMMANELLGTETNLELYYKFNQGTPDGNNTSITTLTCEIGGGTRDANLMNFAMNGTSSNFSGTLNTSFQAISFDNIPNKLVSADPFPLIASSTSGLPVQFEVVSGPATLTDTIVTLTGTSGTVEIKASQPGDATYDPAIDVINSFEVLDPATFVPVAEIRHPLAGDVMVPELTPINLAAFVSIDYPELFDVQDVEFKIDTLVIPATNHLNGYYTCWWEPTFYGAHTIEVLSYNNYGSNGVLSVDINIVQAVSNTTAQVCEDIWIETNNPSEEVVAELPSFFGAFDQITATLNVHCPSGGCGEYDRKASVDVKGHDGKWVEIIRYITPYAVACNHSIDLTDYMSLLQGKVVFRINCSTFDNGYLYDIALDYHAGTPTHKYSKVDVIWQDTYPFGDYADLQPVDTIESSIPANAADAKFRLVTTGHGWNVAENTGNAAEFYEATHKVKFNDDVNDQHLWATCSPNPDGCAPQYGTYLYNRAGWCPGAIANVYEYDLSSYIGLSSLSMIYEFYPDYVDYCHVNHPDCVSGQTCDDCSAGTDPNLIVSGNMITYFDSPYEQIGINEPIVKSIDIQAFPNPTVGEFVLSSNGNFSLADVTVYDVVGHQIMMFEWEGQNTWVDLSDLKRGIYYIQVTIDNETVTKRILLQ